MSFCAQRTGERPISASSALAGSPLAVNLHRITVYRASRASDGGRDGGKPRKGEDKGECILHGERDSGPSAGDGGGIGLKLDGAAQDEPHAPIIALRANRKGGRGMHPTIYCQTY